MYGLASTVVFSVKISRNMPFTAMKYIRTQPNSAADIEQSLAGIKHAFTWAHDCVWGYELCMPAQSKTI